MRAAFYECESTPPLGGFMWGHYQKILATGVLDRLYIKAGVFEENGNYAAIVTADTCSLVPGIHKIVTDRIAEYTPIPPECVCISSNHSHSGAPISSDPSCEGKADEAYLSVFLRLLADAVILAYQRLEDTEATFAISQVNGISFNRNFITTSGKLVTHGRKRTDIVAPLDGIDPDLPVLFFRQQGKPIGAIINFACHQCCLGSYGEGYSGDYSSVLSRHLKEQYGHDFVSLFVLGACGDINHVNPDPTVPIPKDHYRHMGKVLADAVISSMERAESVPGGVAAIYGEVTIRRRPVERDAVVAQVNTWLADGGNLMRNRNLLHYQATHDHVESDTLPVQALRIGDVLISILPGEVFNAYGKYIKENSGYTRNMVVENCNEYCGYIPTLKAFAPESDLYETSLCRHSCLIPEAGTILSDKVLELAAKLDK